VKNALRASDVVVVNSDWTRKHLLEARVLEERIETIVGGMDLGVFHPPADKDALRASLGLAADEKVLVTAGNLIRNKNFDTVIQAMAELVKEGHRNLQYFVVGDGDHQDRLEHLVSSLKLSDRVVFTGRVSQSDLSKYYQAADLYVQVSVEESMGRTYFEAGGCGIPVIGARVGGVPSVIEDGKNGVLVNEPDNVSEVAAKIRQLLLNPRDRRRMGEEGVRLARDKFSWKRVVSQFEAAMKIQ
jgi:glycosyltransferase involved in cell wall biosynthesis